ncbi:hypothetical protein NEUTE1DRAFT_138874 [Neurospora tetrasperma FGSC 2508]|uniref:Myb-like DNA-binding domain-containing protein n=1 Tax=Neurospora tetrasperma (strain FGSC 2508 / ATCC MYA-4615 / P0657) TaxID=510951 RepID=F8MQZ9_NEUT8|nr:uncharacterized protein NEUTE1DRAFT_138874 [Neurospora tetrasperma FGSC 2508]EGO56779.1 hypothetical protein NEUTE1DRAFT_138874 [Neurospora tetrasperma FGSC 2508]EGZ70335.1 hypothetical protein NEUTE2DRAFT_67094 [Neurospora tetrasperma FGSC 2509]
MPPKANQDVAGQMNFLLTCIKHSTNGKINWTEVAEELSIVSKAAAAKRYERLLKAHDIQPPKNYGSLTDDVGASGASSPAKAKTPRAPRSTKRKRATATINYNEDSGNEEGSGDNREPFTYKAEPEDSDDDEKQRPLKKEKTTPEMQTKQEEEDDGESDYFSCCSDDVDLLDEEDAAYGWEGKGYDVLMDVVGRIEGEDNYKYEGEI